MTTLKILSRKQFESYRPTHGAVAISIIDPSEERPDTSAYVDMYPANFYDLFEDIPGSNLKTISSRDALGILAFASEYAGHVPEFVIHCHAGISRSVAVGAALTTLLPAVFTFDGQSRRDMETKGNETVYNRILEAETKHGIIKRNWKEADHG